MLDQGKRRTILELHKAGRSQREIARLLGVSRDSVQRIVEADSDEVPEITRQEKAGPFKQRIIELRQQLKGNMVLVHEALVDEGCDISYSALTAFCRREGIGYQPKAPAGRYHFPPGSEMQHDTSPHDVRVGGTVKKAHAASVVLCYSRKIFFQYYPYFDRFTCKVFLRDAAEYFSGVCKVCMVDNTSVVRQRGTGGQMVPATEMEDFGKDLGFVFRAHEVGDANRSARVERPFHFIENNFLPGRDADDWDDLNRQALAWCNKISKRKVRRLQATREERFAEEMAHLVPLPLWLPEVYRLHQRIVDLEGLVSVNSNRYSVPLSVAIGTQVEAREYKDSIEIYVGPRLVATHKREIEKLDKRIVDPDHRRNRKPRSPKAMPEQKAILRSAPELEEYIEQLRSRHSSWVAARRLRQVYKMLNDYPRQPVLAAFAEAQHYGLYDVERVERMVIKRIAGDYFNLPDDAVEGSDRHE